MNGGKCFFPSTMYFALSLAASEAYFRRQCWVRPPFSFRKSQIVLQWPKSFAVLIAFRGTLILFPWRFSNVSAAATKDRDCGVLF